MKKLLLYFLLAVTALYNPNSILADSKSIKVEVDTYANEAYADKAYESVGSVTISNEPINRFGYLKFNDVNLPPGAVVDKAIFKFYVHEQNYATEAKLNLGPVKDDWNGSSLSWNNRPSIYQSEAIEARISLDFGWKEIDITSIYSRWESGDDKGLFVYPYGFLYGAAENDFAFSFRSLEAPDFGQPADIPQLVVEYHLPPSPSPSPNPSPSPSPNPSPSPEIFSPEPSIEDESDLASPEALSAEEESSPSASPNEEEKTGKAISLPLIIGGIGFTAIVLGGGLIFLSKKKKKQTKTKTSSKKSKKS
ncbi:DNRLRE domain-containing protein [Patescibacteria group bacterium]